MSRGKTVFADTCAVCHSSKQPPAGIESGSEAAAQWSRTSAGTPEFWGGSTRPPTPPPAPIWESLPSQPYKGLEPMGGLETFDPLNPSSPFKFTAPGRGVGYYRVPSLISMWTSAPYLHT